MTEREKLQAERDRAGADRSAWVLKLSAENARLRRLVDLWEGKIPPELSDLRPISVAEVVSSAPRALASPSPEAL